MSLGPTTVPVTFARYHFSGARLSDRRRVQRVCKVAAAFAAAPGTSLPKAFSRPYDVKAAYTLFDHAEATPDNLQAGHRERVLADISEPGTVLLLEDTTEMIWYGAPMEGLGMVSSSKGQGFLLHSVLAVRWHEDADLTHGRPPLEVVGLADQQYFLRQPIPDGEGNNDTKARKYRDRESLLWPNATERIGRPASGVTLIRVCDRGADIYEFIRSCQDQGHDFVVRAAQDRVLLDPATGKRSGKLLETVRTAPSLGEFTLDQRSRGKIPARQIRLHVSAVSLTVRSPETAEGKAGVALPLPLHVVRVWEPVAEGQEGLEWILLVNDPVTDFAGALRRARQYASRWLIEEFHKALKTGMGAEDLQLETGHRLFAAISIMSVVALRLVGLKETLRLDPDAPAVQAGLDQLELRILQHHLGRKNLKTVRDVALAIGRLGGHMNRKGDGMPGLITLWRGMTHLQAMVEGARIALRINQFG